MVIGENIFPGTSVKILETPIANRLSALFLLFIVKAKTLIPVD